MTVFERENIIARYNALFGRGWRLRVSEALQIDPSTITKMRGPTLTALGINLEWLENTPRRYWPERWRELPRKGN